MEDDLKAFLTEQFGALRTEIKAGIKALDAKMEAKFLHHEAVLTEKMRDMQTELLRGFQAFSTPLPAPPAS